MAKVVFTLALVASGLLAQAPAPGPPVRLSAVALDAGGQPVTDLTADDFKIVDQNKPQAIFFFREPRNRPAVKLESLEFSNRTSGVTPHVTVILFDLMNQNQPDRLILIHQVEQDDRDVRRHTGGPIGELQAFELNSRAVPGLAEKENRLWFVLIDDFE